MRRIVLAVFAVAVLAACQPVTTELTEEQKAAIADTVRQLADTFFENFRFLDFVPAMAPYAPELVWAESGVLGANRDSLANAWGGIFASIQEVTSGDGGGSAHQGPWPSRCRVYRQFRLGGGRHCWSRTGG